MANWNKVVAHGAPGVGGSFFSQAIKSGDFVFISGQFPFDMTTGELSKGSIAEQTRFSLKNAATIAEAAGTSLDNAVKVTIFLADIADFDEFNSTYATMFAKDPPARTCIAVPGLPLNARIQIEVICAL